jgi:hypothetical protein
MVTQFETGIDPYGNFEAICGKSNLTQYDKARRISFFNEMLGYRPTTDPSAKISEHVPDANGSYNTADLARLNAEIDECYGRVQKTLNGLSKALSVIEQDVREMDDDEFEEIEDELTDALKAGSKVIKVARNQAKEITKELNDSLKLYKKGKKNKK